MRAEYSGWFVEVPRSLKAEFKKLYPGRSAQRRVTLAAIEWAIANHPSHQNGKANVTQEMQGTDTAEDQMHSEAALRGRTLPDSPQEESR